MSSISIRLEGEMDNLLKRLEAMASTDRAGIMAAMAETLRTSTVERFNTQTSPPGDRWHPSVRADSEGGKTLTKSAVLKNSINAQSDSTGAAVGTNTVYAATHQFGDKRTIRAKGSGYLRFKIPGRWVSVPSVRVNIPARPFLGVSKEDENEIKALIDDAFGE